ncbi:MAG: hypothetical protein U9N55_08025 [candidate division Zixibacteria bacterium]|nr:hypothetical protein [candidate division Zixibacteria bacterium]
MISTLLSCATAYKQQGFTGGYSETRLDNNVFRVTFKGNGYTSHERATDFCLLRSAELALYYEYSYFIIVDASEYTAKSTYTTPTRSRTNVTVSSYGNTSYGNANTTTYGGQTYLITKPRSTNTIVCFREKSDIGGLVYNAKFIKTSISDKYNIHK